MSGIGTAARRPDAAEPSPLVHAARPFRPAWWLSGAHAQTLGARLLRAKRPIRHRRERIDTADGDFLDLDFAARRVADERPGSRDRAAPLVVVLHGLEGCSSSSYIAETCRALADYGLRAVALNFRSRSGEPNRRPGSYHAGKSDDLARALEWLAEREPGTALGAVGFSLGGNVLLKHLGESGGGTGLSAAVAVSVPFDLARSADRMERGLARLYSLYFLRSLRKGLRRKAELFPDAYALGRGLGARTIREFDGAVTAPVHGFRDAEHYYRASSSAPYLDGVRVPTLVLHALDDPLVPADAVPLAEIRRHPWLVDGTTARGGHVGFVTGPTPGRAEFWAEREAARYLAAALRGEGRP